SRCRFADLADGITDSLTTDLSRALPGSFVVSRDTAFTYKGSIGDMRRIGRELDVRYALTGSVFPDGERLRVNAKLVDAQAGAQLWAERFDVERTDFLEVQDEIVGRLARAIGLKVIDFEGRRTERERPKSTDATDLLMRAKVIANRPSSRMSFYTARVINDLCGQSRTVIVSASPGEFNESTQHLLILADEEVCEWRGMHGHRSGRNRRLRCGSAGRAVKVWRTSRERLRGGTRAASIGSWLAMEGLLQRHAGGLW